VPIATAFHVMRMLAVLPAIGLLFRLSARLR
jgi:hypothetical protein